jgi:hypothetical protein
MFGHIRKESQTLQAQREIAQRLSDADAPL